MNWGGIHKGFNCKEETREEPTGLEPDIEFVG